MSQAGGASRSPGGPSQQAEGPRGGGHYAFSKGVLVSQAGGCRVLAFCGPLGCLLASQPTPQATLVPGGSTLPPSVCVPLVRLSSC